MVAVEVENRSGAQVDEAAAVELVRRVLAEEGIESGEVGLAFVAPEESRALKREHLGVDELPDGPPRALGDLVLCPQVVGAGWRRPLVHGVLHLLGYDHGPEMERREEELA
jgi:ssRNA-specific RNase YbeY (16S rRNA maturation enzyme)